MAQQTSQRQTESLEWSVKMLPAHASHKSIKRWYSRQGIVDTLHSWHLPWKRDVPLVRGVDRILLTDRPPPPASEVVLLCGGQPPRYLWYMLSGAICDVLQIATLFVLHSVISDGTICWALGFCLSIPCRHSSHRYLVFGDYVGGYYRSLGRMYTGYSVIIVLSTLFNYAMGKVLMLPVAWLWLLTLMWTGIANYFILKYFWSYGGVSTKSSGKNRGSSTAVAATEMEIRIV